MSYFRDLHAEAATPLFPKSPIADEWKHVKVAGLMRYFHIKNVLLTPYNF